MLAFVECPLQSPISHPPGMNGDCIIITHFSQMKKAKYRVVHLPAFERRIRVRAGHLS